MCLELCTDVAGRDRNGPLRTVDELFGELKVKRSNTVSTANLGVDLPGRRSEIAREHHNTHRCYVIT